MTPKCSFEQEALPGSRKALPLAPPTPHTGLFEAHPQRSGLDAPRFSCPRESASLHSQRSIKLEEGAEPTQAPFVRLRHPAQ